MVNGSPALAILVGSNLSSPQMMEYMARIPLQASYFLDVVKYWAEYIFLPY
ncbi:MAG: hypothetical protein H6R01_1611 [Burkholderiaceae bacterium]|nr:hypothetical protein [Burkholderiaceae bacterium]